MDLETARFLASAAGLALRRRARELADVPAWRRPAALAGDGPAEAVRAALAEADARARAGDRLPEAPDLLLLPDALEPATAWPVARERAGRWPGRPDVPLVDLTAGHGLDALAAAVAGRPVVAYEQDPVRAWVLAHNAEVLGVAGLLAVRAEDALAARPRGPLGFLDPDRRPGGRRRRDPEAFAPPRRRWSALLAGFATWMVKTAPVATGPEDEAEPLEIVSLGGRVRERRLLGGTWAGAPPRRALALPGGEAVAGRPAPWPPPRAPWPGAWLLDPDASVTVADLVGPLAARHDLAPVHPRIAYLLGETPPTGAPGHVLAVEAVLPARAAAIDAWLAEAGIGRLVIRTRGVARAGEAWRRHLHPRGPHAGTLVVTRGPDDRWVALVARDDGVTRPPHPGGS